MDQASILRSRLRLTLGGIGLASGPSPVNPQVKQVCRGQAVIDDPASDQTC